MSRELKLVGWSRGFVTLRVGTSHDKSATYLIWCPWASCKWRCYVFNLPSCFKRPPHWGIIQIFGWKLLVVYHHSDKFGDNWHQVEWRYKVLNLSSGLTGPRDWRIIWHYRWKPLMISYHHTTFGGDKHCGSEDVMILICHVISQDHLTKEPCSFINTSNLR